MVRRRRLTGALALAAMLGLSGPALAADDPKSVGASDSSAATPQEAPSVPTVQGPTGDTSIPTQPVLPPPPAEPPKDKPKDAPQPPKNLVPIPKDEAVTVLGKKVTGPAGEDMGRVVDLLLDRDGKIKSIVIDFGGFLGVGSRKIAIDWQLVHFTPDNKDAPIALSLGKAEVQAAPEYKDNAQPPVMVGPPPSPPTPPPPAGAPDTPAPDVARAPASAPDAPR